MTAPKAGRPRRPPLTSPVRARIAADARAFLTERYELTRAQESQLAAVPIAWRSTRAALHANYVGAAGHGFGGPHIVLFVSPGGSAWRGFYKRVTVGLTTPPGGLEMPLRSALVLTLVHEYTHAIQYGACGIGVRRGEVEPTRNEILFLRRHAPELYARLVPVERRRKRSRAPRRAAASPPRVATRLEQLMRRLLRGW